MSPEVLQLCDPRGSTPALAQKDSHTKGQKMGPGYSRILTAAKEQPDFESLFRITKHEEPKKKSRNQKNYLTHRTIKPRESPNSNLSSTKLAPIYSPESNS